MNQLKIIFLTILITLISCENQNNDTRNQVELIKNGEYKIELDSMTGFFTPYLQTLEYKKGQKNLALLNPLINRIQIYNLEDGKMISTIDYDLVGPNGIGKKPEGFNIINSDSIFIFDTWTCDLSLINSQGIKSLSINLAPNGLNNGYAVPQASTQRPIKTIGGKIYMAGLLLPWSNVSIFENQFLELDLDSNYLSYLLKRPDLYNQFNWGERVMYYLNYDYNASKNEFVFGFNNYDKIIVSDLSFRDVREYETPSIYFKKIIPYDKRTNTPWDKNKIEQYRTLNPRYWAIIYDPFRELTYRFALYPNSIEEYNSGKRRMNASIIILDKNYRKIGEHALDTEMYDSRMYFISEKGLNIAVKPQSVKQENLLVFETFEPRFNKRDSV